MRLKLTLFISIIIIFISGITYGSTSTAGDFVDIPSNHWAIEAINWGLSNNITSGYGNGIFAPDKNVSEAEFAAILARFATNLPETFTAISDKPWSEPYYLELGKYELPFRGYDKLENRDVALSRGNVAQIVAAKYGFNLTVRQAVYFMYENELSSGKSTKERTYESYGVGDPLTRAQALTFLKNMTNFDTKEMTFLGNKSVKGFSNSTTILGVSGIIPDTKIVVDFAVFNPVDPNAPTTPTTTMSLEEITTVTTKVVDGKVVAVQGLKITTPTKVDGVDRPALNYFVSTGTVMTTVQGAVLKNSIINFKGVDLPYGNFFTAPEGMLKFDDIIVGIVQLSLEYSGNISRSAYTDATSFVALLQNLKQLGATQQQIDKAIPIILENQDKNTGAYIYQEITSKSKNTSILLVYGRRGVTVGLYSRPMQFDQGRIYVD